MAYDPEDEFLNPRELSILDHANSLLRAGRLKWDPVTMELRGRKKPVKEIIRDWMEKDRRSTVDATRFNPEIAPYMEPALADLDVPLAPSPERWFERTFTEFDLQAERDQLHDANMDQVVRSLMMRHARPDTLDFSSLTQHYSPMTRSYHFKARCNPVGSRATPLVHNPALDQMRGIPPGSALGENWRMHTEEQGARMAGIRSYLVPNFETCQVEERPIEEHPNYHFQIGRQILFGRVTPPFDGGRHWHWIVQEDSWLKLCYRAFLNDSRIREFLIETVTDGTVINGWKCHEYSETGQTMVGHSFYLPYDENFTLNLDHVPEH